MYLHINQADGTPLYLQIINQIKYLIGSKALEAGAELPPIRALAEQLLINPNTVARAYRELQLEGYLIKKGTTGTYVSDSASPLARSTQIQVLEKRIDSLLADAKHMNISTTEIKQLIDEREALMRDLSSLTGEKKLRG